MDYREKQRQRVGLQTSILIPPYGLATREAAQAAVFRLGKEHPLLSKPSIAGLSSIISTFLQSHATFPMLEKYLDDLKSEKSRE